MEEDFEDRDEAAAHRLRREMVEEVARLDPDLDPAVLAALERVPRHRFLPGVPLVTAYANHAYPIGYGQTISQPTVVAVMTDALDLTGRERVLEIGTGSGYQAAVLGQLAGEVWSIEAVGPLAATAAERLAALGYTNVHVREGDGSLGEPAEAPFDRIVVTAAPERLPDALVEQLAEGGILVAPVGTADQRLLAWRKRDGVLEPARDLGGVRFVPLV